MFLSNKLAANVSEFGTIELAFRKIRSVTGLFDITEVVEKFLTKENSYHELMNMIILNKNNKEQLINRNNELEAKIEKFSISEKNSVGTTVVEQLYGQIYSLSSSNHIERNRQAKMHGTMINIKNWAKRNIKKLSPNTVFGNESLTELMTLMKILVIDALGSLKIKPNAVIIKKNLSIEAIEKPARKDSMLQKKFIINNDQLYYNLSDLNHIENENMNIKKRVYFIPIVEKTLKKF